MKLNAELWGIDHYLVLKFDSRQVVAEVDGRSYDVEVHERDENGYLLLDGTKVYDCRVEHNRNLLTVHLRQLSYPIRIIDPKRLRSAESVGRQAPGLAEIIAPMPGKVVRLLVAEGARVEAGSSILVVEAMKMQNELKTPKTGTVVSIPTEAGATVNAGDILAVVE